ncbi:hypothetical protein GCM10023067_57840 [Aminobacter aganoensis]
MPSESGIASKGETVLQPKVQQFGIFEWSLVEPPVGSVLVMQSGLPNASSIGVAAIAPDPQPERAVWARRINAATSATNMFLLCSAALTMSLQNGDYHLSVWVKIGRAATNVATAHSNWHRYMGRAGC